jgi:hypothetical protein
MLKVGLKNITKSDSFHFNTVKIYYFTNSVGQLTLGTDILGHTESLR